ncbi:uncharacterized protein UDID_07232 [Ustilago sp. UG-2017a]|nr:uncharacterized protein UDID_07232 [Ustilago sp. UG-2017a]
MPHLSLPLLFAALFSTLFLLASAEPIQLSSPNHEHHIGTTVPHIPAHLASLSSPRIHSSPRQLEKRSHHQKNKTKPNSPSSAEISDGKLTYYFGSQLLNPACPGAPAPKDGSMIAAISFDSPFKCGDRIRIQDGRGKEVVVTAVDRCAGCKRHWIDVTKGVFRHFSPLDKGVLEGMKLSKA